jgi:cyclic-di-GMP-binding protein
MLELLEWGKKRGEETADPGSDPESAQASLAGLGDAEPSTALGELALRLEAHSGGGGDAKARNEALALIQDTGAPHVAALLARCFADTSATQAAREAIWKSLVDYQSRLARALCVSAGAQLTAQSAARALAACRTLAKIHLVHYESVPGKLWHVAYAIHGAAASAGCSTFQVHAQSGQRTMTTVEQELLRLLMLRVSAPDMMAPEQIEVADRVVEQLGAEFTLRRPGLADNPFCFEPASEFAPRRAKGREPGAGTRYFGPGMGYDSLQRIARQLRTGKLEDFKPFGKDISSTVQSSAVQHLLTFWRVDCPYSPPVHASASGTLQVVHGHGPLWQFLCEAPQGVRELSLAESSAGAPQTPDSWELRGTGGSELGAELPQSSRAWAKCGELVGVSLPDGGERCAGMIRRMHARPDGGLHADVAVLSRSPKAVTLREVLGKYDDSVFSDASSRQFAQDRVHAIILADGAEPSQPPNLLLPAQAWKDGRIYEAQEGEAARCLRGLQAVRRGGDFVRATFEWL